MPKAASPRTESATLHFNLPQNIEQSDLTLHVGIHDYPIRVHTPRTLRSHFKDLPLLRNVPATHFVADAPLPAGNLTLMHVTKPASADGTVTEQVLSMAIHVPSATRRKYLQS